MTSERANYGKLGCGVGRSGQAGCENTYEINSGVGYTCLWESWLRMLLGEAERS